VLGAEVGAGLPAVAGAGGRVVEEEEEGVEERVASASFTCWRRWRRESMRGILGCGVVGWV
jgi:hypothetical protein